MMDENILILCFIPCYFLLVSIKGSFWRDANDQIKKKDISVFQQLAYPEES